MQGKEKNDFALTKIVLHGMLKRKNLVKYIAFEIDLVTWEGVK